MVNKPAPSQIQDRYIVRMPDGMRDRIAETAKANNRSMNAEIVARLEASFDSPATALATSEMAGLMAQIDNRMAELNSLKTDMEDISNATIKTLIDHGVKLPKRFSDRLKKPKS